MKKKAILLLLLLLVDVLLLTTFTLYSNEFYRETIQDKSLLTNGGPSCSNVTLISDEYNGVYWNTGTSRDISLAVDEQGTIHAAWQDSSPGPWGSDFEIMYSKYTVKTGWTYPIVISDGYQGSYWNDQASYNPSLTVDKQGSIHVVWPDYTDGTWGTDPEILYAKYTPDEGWSNVTVISDGYGGSYWNNGYCYYPSIAVDDIGGVHVAWQDSSSGPWKSGGTDYEIMYVKYSLGDGWSNVSIISDGYGGSYWNTDRSEFPSLDVDNQGGVHVVWQDDSDGPWGADFEILYSKYTSGGGWSNATPISDGYGGSYWNHGFSKFPSLKTDDQGGVHVVWQDDSDGPWGADYDIMYVKYTLGNGWSNATLVSDGYGGTYWNTGDNPLPTLDVDGQGGVHVVWEDETNGPWGGESSSDTEIMYSFYTDDTGWIYPLLISDGYQGSYWNDGQSYRPSLAFDKQGFVHIAWDDLTIGPWGGGTDSEIMYVSIEFPIEESETLSQTPSGFTLSTNAEDPDTDGMFYLKWTRSDYAEEYSVHVEKIVINSTVEELASGLTDRTFPVMGLSNGNYTFHVKAHNAFGTTSSNEVNVTVDISPLEIEFPSDETPGDEEPENPSISFGSFYLAFLALGIITVSLTAYYKRFRQQG